MRNRIWLSVCLILVAGLQLVQACDICGCNLGNHSVGMMNAFNKNQIAFKYNLNSFKSSQNVLNKVLDNFNYFELSVNYFLTDRLKLVTILPYHLNQRDLNGGIQEIRGLGDIRLGITHTMLKQYVIGDNTNIQFDAGLSINLPTGKYEDQIHDQGLPENFNLGKGSWGLGLEPQMILNHKDFGILWSAYYLHQFKTNSGYHFGNQFSTQLLLFYEMNFNESIKWMPYAGIHKEWAKSDRFSNDILVHGTGADGVFVSMGMNFKYKDWMAGLTLALPVSQNYSNGETKIIKKLTFQMNYFF